MEKITKKFVSQETRNKLRLINTGKKHSKEAKIKMSKNMLGKTKEQSHHWKGGKHITKKGYIWIRFPEHPFVKKNKYISEHRLIMEKKIGRYLSPSEVVHHINHNPSDNRIENLMLCDKSKHAKIHYQRNK